MMFVQIIVSAAVIVTAAAAFALLPFLFWNVLTMPAATLDDDPTTTEGTRHD